MDRIWLAGVLMLALACGGSTTVTCPLGAGTCSGRCTDLSTDASNCGACGQGCSASQVCSSGVCVAPLLVCGGGRTSCSGACVDTATDASNCGACGHACQAGLSCSAGSCQCGGGSSLCGSSCVNLTTDPSNCGACGQACNNGETCAAGSCQCAAGSQACGTSTACVDLTSDGDNCGTCGRACPVLQTCVASACVASDSAFRMLGGDAVHSGLNAQETGIPPLAKAWVAPGAGGGGPPVVEGGRVISIGGSWLHALEASTGAELWAYNFQVLGGIGWPAVYGGKVYVATSNNYADTWLREFDRATGTVGFKVGFSSQWEQYWSPIIVGNSVYSDGGTYGGLYDFDANAGTQLFFSGTLEQYDQWSPAFFGGRVFTFVAGNVRAQDPATGAVQGTLNVGWTWSGWSMKTAPAFGDTYGYVISPPNLFAFDPSLLKQVWTVNGAFTAYPAVAGGVVYALSGGALVALDANTGVRKWVFAGDGHLAYPPVIAAGYVYVASDANVYAINAATHQQVWTAPAGGRLAIGAGMLFVSRTSDGSLVAFRLTH